MFPKLLILALISRVLCKQHVFTLKNVIGEDYIIREVEGYSSFPILETEFHTPDVTDLGTVLEFAKMASNAYLADTKEWLEVPYETLAGFGFLEDGLRGYIFGNDDNSLIILSFKGTSAKFFGIGQGETANRDKFTVNKHNLRTI